MAGLLDFFLPCRALLWKDCIEKNKWRTLDASRKGLGARSSLNSIRSFAFRSFHLIPPALSLFHPSQMGALFCKYTSFRPTTANCTLNKLGELAENKKNFRVGAQNTLVARIKFTRFIFSHTCRYSANKVERLWKPQPDRYALAK